MKGAARTILGWVGYFRIYSWISPYFRRRRFQRFLKALGPGAETTILDVGGSAGFWKQDEFSAKLTILNRDFPSDTQAQSPYPLVVGDGCDLHQFKDASFDIVFSNSVIEHVSNFANQQKFANEVRRVGKRLWIQTPARWFFVEPHLITPFIHYLPRSWQRHLLRRFTIWGWILKPSPQMVEKFLDEIRLLTYREMQQLFPDCRILRERFLGMTKSFIAVR